MSSKQRDEIRNLNRTMDAYRHENDALAERLHRALTERDDLRARLAELESADPAEPRPFRVGDRVRVAEGATYQTILDQVAQSWVGGRTGRVCAIAADEDLYVQTDDADGAEGHVSPEFCTLIEAESEPQCVPGCTMSPGHHPPCCICGPGSATCRRGCPDRHETTPPFGYPAATISDAAEPKADTPQSVTLTLPDGTSVTFDAVVTR